VDLPELKFRLTRACNNVIEAEPRITQFDTVVGDGDCGETLKRAALAVLDTLGSNKLTSDVVQTVETLADVIEDHMDGTSGALYAIFVSALAASLNETSKSLKGQHMATKAVWASALSQAFHVLQKATPARIGDRTVMDALEPFVSERSSSQGNDPTTALQKAIKGKESTMGMQPAFGRSVYVQESGWDQVPDPGAEGLVCLLQGLIG